MVITSISWDRAPTTMVIKHYKHLTLLVPLVHPQVVDVLNIAEDR